MNIEDLNKLINECIDKYDLEGHETVFGGMLWFVKKLQPIECKCIDDHLKNQTYQFVTPRYDGTNAEEISEIIKKHSENIDKKLIDV